MEEFYSHPFEYEYSESEEDEEILPLTMIPRHLHQKLTGKRYYGPGLREDELESDEDEEIPSLTKIPRHLHQKLTAKRYYDPRLTEDELESDEDEEILSLTKIPRHLRQKIMETRYYDPRLREDELESDKDEEIPSLTKVVIRHLPPRMNGKKFFELVSPLPAHDYKYFAEANKEYKENAYATAYINFVDSEDASLFMKKFDGHAFHCSNGKMYKATVEFAPSGQIPKPLPSRDSLGGTIDNDPDYLEFLASRETKTTDMPKEEDEITEATSKHSTPLVDYLNRERAEWFARRKYRPHAYFRNMHSKFRPMVG